MGTTGELYASVESSVIKYTNLITGEVSDISIDDAVTSDSIISGHGGGDHGIMCSLYDVLNGDASAANLSNISISVKNHKIVFAAERSRLEGRVVSLDEFN